MTKPLETVTLGAGCFWCVEAVYQELKGVHRVESGYAGGSVENPTYHEVCNGRTGHAEVVQVTFDPEIIDFATILEVFWRTHDPTTMNRQGADVGTQYRSAIFYHTDEQRQIAEKSKQETNASGLWENPIVTEITPFTRFYPAEDYHQNFYRDNPAQPYCRVMIDPKIRKLRKDFEARINEPEPTGSLGRLFGRGQ
jgi:peptide-methionine (S)-S-oxide reductase